MRMLEMLLLGHLLRVLLLVLLGVLLGMLRGQAMRMSNPLGRCPLGAWWRVAILSILSGARLMLIHSGVNVGVVHRRIRHIEAIRRARWWWGAVLMLMRA